MGLNTAEGLFFYELGILRDAEQAGGKMLGWIAGHIQHGDLQQALREEEQASERQSENIVACLRVLGAAPLETPSSTVEGIRQRLEQFLGLRPAPEVVDLFAVGTAIRFMYFAISSYQSMIDWTSVMGETECVRNLQTNLAQKEQGVQTLERFSHQLTREVLTPA
ncbi:YciE/YciF ferroxidase family protein [Micromonospora sp. NPDC003197]